MSAVVKFDFNATEPNQLSVLTGDLVTILKPEGLKQAWVWVKESGGRKGYIPSQYVQVQDLQQQQLPFVDSLVSNVRGSSSSSSGSERNGSNFASLSVSNMPMSRPVQLDQPTMTRRSDFSPNVFSSTVASTSFDKFVQETLSRRVDLDQVAPADGRIPVDGMQVQPDDIGRERYDDISRDIFHSDAIRRRDLVASSAVNLEVENVDGAKSGSSPNTKSGTDFFGHALSVEKRSRNGGLQTFDRHFPSSSAAPTPMQLIAHQAGGQGKYLDSQSRLTSKLGAAPSNKSTSFSNSSETIKMIGIAAVVLILLAGVILLILSGALQNSQNCVNNCVANTGLTSSQCGEQCPAVIVWMIVVGATLTAFGIICVAVLIYFRRQVKAANLAMESGRGPKMYTVTGSSIV